MARKPQKKRAGAPKPKPSKPTKPTKGRPGRKRPEGFVEAFVDFVIEFRGNRTKAYRELKGEVGGASQSADRLWNEPETQRIYRARIEEIKLTPDRVGEVLSSTVLTGSNSEALRAIQIHLREKARLEGRVAGQMRPMENLSRKELAQIKREGTRNKRDGEKELEALEQG